MKHSYYLLLILFLTPFLAAAQSNYKPGYVVTLNGDTLKGYVDYKEWAKNPRELNFKKDIADNQKNIYTVNNCNAFAVNGFEYYRRFIVSVSQDKVAVSNLSTGPDTTANIDTAFLRLLSSGKNVSLYSFKDVLKERFFIAENNATPTELIRRLYLSGGETSQIVTQKTYTRQLQQLAAKYQPGNGKLINDIPATGYDETALKKIVNRVNGSSDQLSQLSQERSGARFFAGIGIRSTNTKFNEFGGTPFSGSYSAIFPQVNLGADIFVNKNVGDLIFRTTLTFTGSNSDFKTNVTNTQFPYSAQLKFKQYTIILNPQLLYNFYNTPAEKIYVAVGVGLNFATYTDKVNTTTSTFDNYVNTYEFPDVKHFFPQITTRAGLILKDKVDIYIGYDTSASINDNEGVGLRESYVHAGINYLFGKK